MRRIRGKFKPDTFRGDVRLHIESVKDFAHLEEFCQYLKSICDLDIVFYSWSENNGVIIFTYLRDFVPLLGKLHQIPIVKAVSKKKKDIVVELNGSYTEIIASIQKTFKEGILVV